MGGSITAPRSRPTPTPAREGREGTQASGILRAPWRWGRSGGPGWSPHSSSMALPGGAELGAPGWGCWDGLGPAGRQRDAAGPCSVRRDSAPAAGLCALQGEGGVHETACVCLRACVCVFTSWPVYMCVRGRGVWGVRSYLGLCLCIGMHPAVGTCVHMCVCLHPGLCIHVPTAVCVLVCVCLLAHVLVCASISQPMCVSGHVHVCVLAYPSVGVYVCSYPGLSISWRVCPCPRLGVCPSMCWPVCVRVHEFIAQLVCVLACPSIGTWVCTRASACLSISQPTCMHVHMLTCVCVYMHVGVCPCVGSRAHTFTIPSPTHCQDMGSPHPPTPSLGGFSSPYPAAGTYRRPRSWA